MQNFLASPLPVVARHDSAEAISEGYEIATSPRLIGAPRNDSGVEKGLAMTGGKGSQWYGRFVLLLKIAAKRGIMAEAKTSESSEGATF